MKELIKKVERQRDKLLAEYRDNSYFRAYRHRMEEYDKFQRVDEFYEMLTATEASNETT